MARDVALLAFTVQVALLSVLAVFPAGVALGFWLARTRSRFRSVVDTLASLPLVLPPTVVGLLLLEVFARSRPFGRFLWETLGVEIPFTWRAVVIASAVMAFPLLVRTVRAAFELVDPRLEKMARSLGRRPVYVFFTISLPLAWRGVLAGLVLAFARALGEFGATILIAGNIPGETQTLSLAIFQLVQTGRDQEAYRLAGFTILVALVAIWLSERLATVRTWRRP